MNAHRPDGSRPFTEDELAKMREMLERYEAGRGAWAVIMFVGKIVTAVAILAGAIFAAVNGYHTFQSGK